MRKIKFRAWWGIKHKFLEGVDKVEFWNNRLYSVNTLFNIEQDEIVLMQFTGLKDKNWKEIYEGDIIDFYGRLIEVRIPDIYISLNNEFSEEDIEVIGNIYQNSELLKELN
jgi:hypothetical protein